MSRAERARSAVRREVVAAVMGANTRGPGGPCQWTGGRTHAPSVGRAGKLGPLSAERVTSVDVARRCGVSQSTVSLVFSGKAAGRISPRTEAAVRKAAAELGYRPNAAARALKIGAARTIVLVVPDVTNPFFGGLLRGAQTAARAAGYAVALIDTNNDRDWGAASAEALHAGPADGLLLFEVDPPAARRAPEPIVVIESEARGHPSVRLDAERGTEAAVRHLLELGHERIGHVASIHDRPTFKLRRRRGRPARRTATSPRVRCDFTLDGAQAATLELLRRASRTDRAVLRRRRDRRRRVPGRARAGAAHPRRPLGRRLRRPRPRPHPRPAADDGRGRRRTSSGRVAFELLARAARGQAAAQPRDAGRARCSAAPPPRRADPAARREDRVIGTCMSRHT